MTHAHAPADAAERFLAGAVEELERALLALAEARARGESGDGALLSLAAALQEVLVGSNLLGRARTLDDATHLSRGAAFARTRPVDVIPGFLPRVVFREALRDLLNRKPILENDYRELARRYSTEKVFGLARSADIVVTKAVRETLAKAWSTSRGTTEAVQKTIAGMGDWSRAYAETVFRTNAATAYTDGRLEKASEPHLRAVIPAVRYVAVHDDDTRPNHMAADGLMAAPDDPVWKILRPPLGYNCRCRTDYVSWEEAVAAGIILKSGEVRRARIPAGAHPDPGFRIAA